MAERRRPSDVRRSLFSRSTRPRKRRSAVEALADYGPMLIPLDSDLSSQSAGEDAVAATAEDLAALAPLLPDLPLPPLRAALEAKAK